MKRRHAVTLSAACCLGLLLHPRAAGRQFGELPPGAVSTSEMGRAEEIVLNLSFDPAVAQDLLPQGVRFRTLEEIARRPDSAAAIAEHLRAHPEHKGLAALITTVTMCCAARRALPPVIARA